MDITNYLIAPIQRLPRYQLLIQELKKSTPLQHPDYEPLSVALEKIVSVNQFLNEEKRNAENVLEIIVRIFSVS